MSYRLKRSEQAGEGVRRVVIERIDRALRRLRDQMADAPGEAVHGARKDIKKARSALRLVRADLGGERYREQNRGLRDAGRKLSDARDAAVRVTTLERLRDGGRATLSADAHKALTDAIAAAAGHSTEVEIEPAAAAAASLLERERDRVGGWELERGGWRLIGPGLDRAYRRGRSAYLAVAADPTDEGVHEWRKRAKDLWYQLRLLNRAWPPVVGELGEQAHELTDLLGDHHDLSLLATEIEGTELTLTGEEAGALAALVREQQRVLLAEALPLGERIYAEKPKAFARRARAYWHAWRS